MSKQLIRENFILDFFEKWKQKRLNTFAKKMLDENPNLENDLKKLDKAIHEFSADIDQALKDRETYKDLFKRAGVEFPSKK